MPEQPMLENKAQRSKSAANLLPRKKSAINIRKEMERLNKQKGHNKIATSRSGYLFANNYKGVTVYKNPEDNMYAGYLQTALSRVPKKENKFKNSGIPFNHAPRFEADFSLAQASPGPVYLPKDYAKSTEAGKWTFGGGPTNRDGFVFGTIHKGVAAPASKSKSTAENISPANYDSGPTKDRLMKKQAVGVPWSKSSTRRFAQQQNSYDINPGPKYFPKVQQKSSTVNFGPKHNYQKSASTSSLRRTSTGDSKREKKRRQSQESQERAELTQEEKEYNREQRRQKKEQAQQLKDLNRWLKRTTWGGRLPRSLWLGKKLSADAKGIDSPGPIYSVQSDNWKLKNESKVLHALRGNVWR